MGDRTSYSRLTKILQIMQLWHLRNMYKSGYGDAKHGICVSVGNVCGAGFTYVYYANM